MATSKDSYTFKNQASIPPAILHPIITLFKSWDMQHTDNAYLDQFTPDATLMFGSTPSRGRDAIQATRESMLHPTRGPIVNSEHNLANMFSLIGGGEDSGRRHEILMNGSIWYLLKNGTRVDADWASRAILENCGGELKIGFYQVYVDSTELMQEIGKMMAGDA